MLDNKSELVLLVSGAAVVGAALGILFAPQSGTKTRKDLRRVTGDFGDQAKEFRDDLKDRIEDWVDSYSRWSRKQPEKENELRKALLDTLESSRNLISDRIRKLEKAVRT